MVDNAFHLLYQILQRQNNIKLYFQGFFWGGKEKNYKNQNVYKAHSLPGASSGGSAQLSRKSQGLGLKQGAPSLPPTRAHPLYLAGVAEVGVHPQGSRGEYVLAHVRSCTWMENDEMQVINGK